jgi:hypothetical protein
LIGSLNSQINFPFFFFSILFVLSSSSAPTAHYYFLLFGFHLLHRFHFIRDRYVHQQIVAILFRYESFSLKQLLPISIPISLCVQSPFCCFAMLMYIFYSICSFCYCSPSMDFKLSILVNGRHANYIIELGFHFLRIITLNHMGLYGLILGFRAMKHEHCHVI